FLGHLLDRFDLELFGVTLTTHGTSYLGLIMRLGGVYETRGDSTPPQTAGNIKLSEHNFSKLKIDKIRRSPTLIISGYGAGIAILFSIFNDQLGMEKKWLATIDATLSICAIIFYTGIIHLISTTKALKELNKEKSNQLEPRKRIQTLSGLLIMISTGLFGLYLIGNSDISPGAKLSSSTTGLILLSSCIIALLIIFEKISKELSGARTKSPP
ncbi:hypothetical protein, partial [Pseudomonas aeruginosa]|uniref:hypothetical protein n=4 Tax=Bacteria TaxID=2 RepID=UPI00359C8DD7